jgi:hypothetical protein
MQVENHFYGAGRATAGSSWKYLEKGLKPNSLQRMAGIVSEKVKKPHYLRSEFYESWNKRF